MDARQYSHIARASALVALFATRPEVDRLAGLPETLALFTAQLDWVETLVERQSQSLAAVIVERDAALTAMKIAALTVAGKVAAGAARSGRGSLALNLQVKRSDLERARLVERVRSCQRIHDTVAAEPEAAAAAGVTAELLADFHNTITAARGFLTAPRATVVDKSTATVQLAEAVRDLNEIITKQIDPLVAPCEFTHREFFLLYRAARKLVARSRGPADSAEDEQEAEAEGEKTTTVASAGLNAATATAAGQAPSASTEAAGVAGASVSSPSQRESATTAPVERPDLKSEAVAVATAPAPDTPSSSVQTKPVEKGEGVLGANAFRAAPPAAFPPLKVAAPPKAA